MRGYPFGAGLAVHLRDVTARHKSQEQLRLLESSIARLNDIVIITEAGPFNAPGPRIVFVNEAFERRTGYSPRRGAGPHAAAAAGAGHAAARARPHPRGAWSSGSPRGWT